jgi:hypothetical protein
LVEVAQWLKENATEYFDSIETSEDGLTINCMLDGIAALSLSRPENGNAVTAVFTGKSGAAKTATQSASNGVYIHKIMKFSTGIGIGIFSSTVFSPCGIFISKTDKDTLGFVWASNLTSVSSTVFMLSFETTNTFVNSMNAGNLSVTTGSGGATSLAPLCCYMVDDYFPNLYLQPQNALRGQECFFTLNGVEYYSNGYFAIKV